MERADLQATSFAGNIDTVHIMLNFENKYLHIQCFLGIFTCEKQIFLLFFLQKWITFKHYTLGRTKIFKLKIIYSKNIHFFCAWPHDIF